MYIPTYHYQFSFCSSGIRIRDLDRIESVGWVFEAFVYLNERTGH